MHTSSRDDEFLKKIVVQYDITLFQSTYSYIQNLNMHMIPQPVIHFNYLMFAVGFQQLVYKDFWRKKERKTNK